MYYYNNSSVSLLGSSLLLRDLDDGQLFLVESRLSW